MPIVDPEPTDDDATNQGVSAPDPAEGCDDAPAEEDGSASG
jgi:hypothetical protein